MQPAGLRLSLGLWLAGAGPFGLVGLAAVASVLARELHALDLDDGADCLKRFRMNRDVGLVVFVVLLAGRIGT